jgi:hypothetical protein
LLRLQPKADLFIFDALVRKVLNLFRSEHKTFGLVTIHFSANHYEVRKQMVEFVAQWNRVAIGKRLDLNCEFPDSILAIGKNVDSPRVARPFGL